MRQAKASLRTRPEESEARQQAPTGELSSSSLIASIEILKLKY